MSPSWRRWGSVTGLPCPFRSDSARNRIEVSGDRRSCAISTTSSSPSGPARLDAKSSDSAVDPESCQRRSTVVAVICRFPLASCFHRHAAGGHHSLLRRRLALDHPARAGTALEPVPSHQAVQRRAVHTRDARRLGHVPAHPVDEPGEVLPLELRDHAVPRGVVALLEQGRHQGRGVRVGGGLLVRDELQVLRLDLRPGFSAASGSPFVAAMKRTFTTASVASLPTRRTIPSWITRSSFAWIGFGISVSSSRNSAPPWAASSRPGLSRTAPVKAPLRCPNISDSSNPSGRAAQFTATNGRLDRRLLWWINWAISSLPLPLSPVMNTDASVGATLRASSIARWNAGAVPSSVILSLWA